MDTNPDSVAVGITDEGVVAFYNPDVQTGIRRLGSTDGDLQDLRDYTRIPTLTGFVTEVFGVNTKTFEEV